MRLLKSKQVAEMLNIGYDKFRKEIKHQPDFPKPVKLTPKSRPQWSDQSVENYLNRKAA